MRDLLHYAWHHDRSAFAMLAVFPLVWLFAMLGDVCA